MNETPKNSVEPVREVNRPLGQRVTSAAWASGRLALYLLLAFAAVPACNPRFRSEPKVFAVIALSITAVGALTYFVFGAAGYTIKGDTLRAPRALVWGFLFLIALTVLLVLLWLEAHNQLGRHR
jgi:FtsH-binding integral membrane protein